MKEEKTITIEEAKRNIEYLLRDWRGNIKYVDIVVKDILSRFDKIKLPKDFDFKKQ